ncbi:MAG: hypothetical protein H6720_27675 [Sandaracinus sp.]|nr:hypothetical protein [Sandaracinus sp.]
MCEAQDVRVLATPRAFRLVAARRGGEARLIVRPGPGADVQAARVRLARLAKAHGAIVHPAVPRTVAVSLEAEVPSVELACAAEADGFTVIGLLEEAGRRIPYPAGDAFIVGLREALEAAHSAGWVLGRISLGNVFFDARGRASLVGFGANVVAEDEHGRADPRVRFFEAPELIAGAPATPMTDYVALLMLTRSVLPHVALPPALERVMHGRSGLAERALIELLRWVESRVIHEAPALRVGLSEALRNAQRIRRLLGVQLDREGFPRLVEELLLREATGDLVVAADASWVQTADGRRRLGAAQRRIVGALCDRHALGNTTPWTTWELFELAWPGESPEAEVAVNRVHAAVSRLRKLGLGETLERFDDGYRLAPTATVVRGRG